MNEIGYARFLKRKIKKKICTKNLTYQFLFKCFFLALNFQLKCIKIQTCVKFRLILTLFRSGLYF